MRKLFILLLATICCNALIAQNTQIIYLSNPSFEDIPHAGRTPESWSDCGHSQESPPDIQPRGGFNVTRPAFHGRTYVGLVTRDNKTWEAMAQRLTDKLKKGTCYKFSLHACKSDVYISPTRKNQSQPTNFNRGLVIRLWAGNSYCERAELLDELKSPVEHTDWREYQFEFTPSNDDYTFICIEAYYKTPTFSWYNGNILIDNASEIFSCEIPTDPVLAQNDPKEKPTNVKPSPEKDPKDPNPTPKEDPFVQREMNTSTDKLVIKDKGNFNPSTISTKDIEIGDKFRLDNLYFKADSSSITNNGEKVLISLYNFLKKNSEFALEVGGHTNGLPPHDYCDRLSKARARSVVAFLERRGIKDNRMSFKGYGKRQPIGDNTTSEGKRKNQRVEIIITDIRRKDD